MDDLQHEAVRHLTVLGVRPGASWAEVHEAYRTLAHVWHPDRFAAGSRIQTRAGERLQVINEAYSWLAKHREVLAALAQTRSEGAGAEPQHGPRSLHGTSGRRRRRRGRPYAMPVLDPPRRQPVWVWGAAGALAVAAFLWAVGGADRGPGRAGPSGSRPLPRTERSSAVARQPQARELYVETREMQVTAGRLNIRASPSTESPIVASVSEGERVRVDAAQGPWRRIVGGEPLRVVGWAHADYLAPAPPARVPTPEGGSEATVGEAGGVAQGAEEPAPPE